MLPQTVNALNLPLENRLIFPAAILEAPFFDAHADDAVNYGAIGAVIGHEISHSFDSSGALFDETGRLANWWTPEDFERFEAAGAALAAQYDQYRPFPDARVNGKLTLGENIADVAGLATALRRLPALAAGQARGRRSKGSRAGPALLPRLRADLARQGARGGVAQQPAHQRARAGPVPRRDRAQPRRLVRGVRREARPEALPGARQAGSRLVNGSKTKQGQTAPKGAVFMGQMNANQRLTRAVFVQKTYTRPGAN